MFKEVLLDIFDRTEGCLGVLIMGTDGIAVEKVWQPGSAETDFDPAVAEYTSLINSAKRKNSKAGLGKLTEVTFSGKSGIFIGRFISDEYFIAMVLTPDGNFGRGRYELRRAELVLYSEFAT